MTISDKDRSAVDVSVIIPNLDGGTHLCAAIDTLFSTTGPTIEVIVVDNGSVDGSADEAVAMDKRVRVLRNQQNLGFAPACNQGAGESRGRLLLFLNNDARITGEALSALAEAMGDERLWAVQPALFRDREGGALDSAGSQFTRTGFLRHLAAIPNGRGPVPIFAAKGACLLVRADRFRYVGGFDDSFFAYFEDSDLCWRMRLAGGDVALVPQVAALHGTGLTTRRFFSPAEIDFMSFRNRLWSILTNCEKRTLLVILPAHLAASLATAIAFLGSGRPSSAAAIVRAMATPLLHQRQWRTKRPRVQELRARSDRGVFSEEVTAPMGPRDAVRLLRDYLPRW
ncbi:MAG: glycosyltransferase family 2 protein [Acidimicrobiales bacterium]